MTSNEVLPFAPWVVWRWRRTTPCATAHARTALSCALDQLGYDGETIQDAALAVSELVANAVEHAVGPYELRLRATAESVVCEVEDHDPRVPKVLPLQPVALYEPAEEHRGSGLDALASVLAERGRGLGIVHVLTQGAWGFRVSGNTKIAWLALPAPAGRRFGQR